MEIKWKKGSMAKGNAEKCYVELEKLCERDGCLLPEAVVQKAKAKRSPLHNAFIWDDSIAAQQHRLTQARYLVRSIEVIYEEAPQVQSRMYRVVSLPAVEDQKPRKAYQSVKEILADPIARDELLSQAIRDALAFRKAYHELSELAKIFQVMDEFVESADKLLEG